MRHAESVRLKRDCEGIDWLALIDLFKLSDLGGRKGDKVRRSFENSDVVCFAFDGHKLHARQRLILIVVRHRALKLRDARADYDFEASGLVVLQRWKR
jgi:hypothetical protein